MSQGSHNTDLEVEQASALLASTQQLRTHWSGVITTHFNLALTINVAIWSYFVTTYVTSDNATFLYMSALSSVLLGLWRFYTRYIDDHLANLYPDLLLCEGSLGLPPDRGTSGYLSREVPEVVCLLEDEALSLSQKVKAVSELVSNKRIGDRAHAKIDLFALVIVIVLSSFSFSQMLKVTSNSEWFLLIGNLIGIVLVVAALGCFQTDPCKQQVQDVRQKYCDAQ